MGVSPIIIPLITSRPVPLALLYGPGSMIPRPPVGGRYPLGWTALEWSDYWFDLADKPPEDFHLSVAQCERNGVLWLAYHCKLRGVPAGAEMTEAV
jgi:hypothetical protein